MTYKGKNYYDAAPTSVTKMFAPEGTKNYNTAVPTAPGRYDVYVMVYEDANYYNSLTEKVGTFVVAGTSKPTFTVTVYGKTTEIKEYAENEEVSITADEKEGYTFTGWYAGDVPAGTVTTNKTITFKMPAHNVTLEPLYEETTVPAKKYVLNVDGKVTEHVEGEEISVTADEKKGYTPRWEADGVPAGTDLTGKTVTFKMPANDVYLYLNYDVIATQKYTLTVKDENGENSRVEQHEENELILPKAEQIPNDFYRKGDTIKAIVKSVEMNNNQPRIILSRTANQFLERLFEQEVPEIFDGLITLKKIVRIPGERAKVAVESYDERIDPVGACVGMKGSRIYSIVKELRNENIDVVNYTTNPQLMIQRALNPAKISSITIDEEKKTASVYLKPDQVSLAIGKGGLNIRLSKMLTGYDIDVYREIEEEDVALTEFADEIDGWVIDALKACGCDTAKSVLELPVEEIAARADLELEQAQKVVEILKAEFEE